jgi:hypothetical protein
MDVRRPIMAGGEKLGAALITYCKRALHPLQMPAFCKCSIRYRFREQHSSLARWTMIYIASHCMGAGTLLH